MNVSQVANSVQQPPNPESGNNQAVKLTLLKKALENQKDEVAQMFAILLGKGRNIDVRA